MFLKCKKKKKKKKKNKKIKKNKKKKKKKKKKKRILSSLCLKRVLSLISYQPLQGASPNGKVFDLTDSDSFAL